jgi:hypothetical protein
MVNTTCATSEARTAYRSRASDFTPDFPGVRVANTSLCSGLWIIAYLFVLSHSAIVLSGLRFTVYDCPLDSDYLLSFSACLWSADVMIDGIKTGHVMSWDATPTKNIRSNASALVCLPIGLRCHNSIGPIYGDEHFVYITCPVLMPSIITSALHRQALNDNK